MEINFLDQELIKKLKNLEKRQKRFLRVSKLFALLGIAFIVLSFAPSVWYSLAYKVDDYSAAILETIANREEQEEFVPTVQLPEWQPAQDSRLPKETTLTIKSIGVKTKVQEAPIDNYENALKLGVWRIPDYGTPSDRSKPLILAAHRFGYLVWTNNYRRQNSFYNLPKVKVGDLIEISYKQRLYKYEVYGEGKGDKITDYSANLILYTCESLNSKVRIFKYARLLEI